MKDSFAQFYALRCLAVGGYLCSTVFVYLASGAGIIALFVWLLHKLFPLLGGPAGVLISIVAIQVIAIASALSCEAMGQALLNHPYQSKSIR